MLSKAPAPQPKKQNPYLTIDLNDMSNTPLIRAIVAYSPSTKAQLDPIIDSMCATKTDINKANSRKITPLNFAAGTGNAELVQKLINSGAEVNALGEYSDNPLMISVVAQSQAPFPEGTTKVLLENGADANSAGYDGVSVLSMALIYKNQPAFQLLLDHGARYNYSFNGASLLHAAVHNNCKEIFKSLINKKVELNIADQTGETPLHLCIIYGFVDMAKMLIDAGADMNAKNINGNTPLHHAFIKNSLPSIEMLISKGANEGILNNKKKTPIQMSVDNNTAMQDQVGRTISTMFQSAAPDEPSHENIPAKIKVLFEDEHPIDWEEILSHPSTTDLMRAIAQAPNANQETLNALLSEIEDASLDTLDTPNGLGLTPLHFAAYAGNLPITEKLLAKKVRVEVKDTGDFTALHISVLTPNPRNISVSEALIKKGADVNTLAHEGSLLVLVISCINDEEEQFLFTKLLLENGAEVNYLSDKHTPLTLAVNANKEKTVELLLNHHADTNLQHEKAAAPLFYSLVMCNVKIAELLLQHKANPNTRGKDKCTLLGHAIISRQDEVAKLLIKHGAEINAHYHEKDKSTALHLAVKENNPEIVKLLLSKKAIIDIKDSRGSTPLHLAAASGHDASLEVLLPHANKIEIFDLERKTPLWLAVLGNHGRCVKLLIENKYARLSLTTFDFLICTSITNKNSAMACLLLTHRASMNDPKFNGRNMVGFAIEHKNMAVLKIALKYKEGCNLLKCPVSDYIHYANLYGFQEAIPVIMSAFLTDMELLEPTPKKKEKKSKKVEETPVLTLTAEEQSKLKEDELKRIEDDRIKKEAEAQVRAAEEAKKKEEKRLESELKKTRETLLKKAFNDIYDDLSALKSPNGATKDFFKGGMRKTAESYIDSQNKDYFKVGTDFVDRQTLAIDILSATGMKKLNSKLFEDLKTKFLNAEKEVQQASPSPVEPPKSTHAVPETAEVSAENDKDKMVLKKALHQQDKHNEAKAAQQRKLASSSTAAPLRITPSSQDEANTIRGLVYELVLLATPYQGDAKPRSLLEMKYDLLKTVTFIKKLMGITGNAFVGGIIEKIEDLEILRNGILHLLEIHSEHSTHSQDSLTDFFFDFYRTILSRFGALATLNIEKDSRLSHISTRIQASDAFPLEIKKILTQMKNPVLAQETFEQFKINYKLHQNNNDNARSNVEDDIKNRIGVLAAPQENHLSREDKVMLAVEIAELYRQRANIGHMNGDYPHDLVTARNTFAHEGVDIADEIIDRFLRDYQSVLVKNK